VQCTMQILQATVRTLSIALHCMSSYNGPMPAERGARLLAQLARGQRLRDLRVGQGLGLTEVAARLGMSASNYSRYESGANDLSGSQIEDFAVAFGLTPRAFMEAVFADLFEKSSENKKHALNFRPEHPAPLVGRMLVGTAPS
jgi:transcriptional regulator with XRE-family HTH domain